MNEIGRYALGGIEQSPESAKPIEEIKISQIIGILLRHKTAFLTTFIVAMLCAAVYIWQFAPTFTAQVSIMIESRVPEIVNIDAVTEQLSVDKLTMQSEMEVLRSRNLIGRVVQKLRLDQDPEFNPTLRPDRWQQLLPAPLWQRLNEPVAQFRGWLNRLLADSATQPAPAVDAEGQTLAAVNAAIQKRLRVTQRPDSRILIIGFTSEDRYKAARIANAIADQYVLQQKEEKLDAARRATAWLNEQVAALQRRVDTADREIEYQKQQSGLLGDGSGVTLLSEQISALNRQLSQAMTERIDLEAKRRYFDDLTESPAGAAAVPGFAERIDAITSVVESRTLDALRDEEVNLQQKRAALAAEYGEHHPEMAKLRAELSELQAVLDEEIARIGYSIAQRLALARSHEALLHENLEGLKQQAREVNVATIGLRKLEREAETSRTFLQMFMSRAEETSAQTDINLQQADARVLSQANVPDQPRLSKRLLLLIALAVAVGLGVMMAFFRELIRKDFSDSQDIERTMAAPVLGSVPRLRRTALITTTPVRFMQKYPHSNFAEAIRGIRTSLLFLLGKSSAGRRRKKSTSVLITSATPGEGKSTVAVCLALAHAQTGRRVIIVDADIRRPRLGQILQVPKNVGLIDFLTGEAPLSEVIQRHPDSGVYVITAGQTSPKRRYTPDLFASVDMDRLIDSLVEACDLIIVDSPPLMHAADARMLSKRADLTLLVLYPAQTRREQALLAKKQIETAGGKFAGVILTMYGTKDGLSAYA